MDNMNPPSEQSASNSNKFNSRKYRVVLLFALLGTAMQMIDKLSDNLLWLLGSLASIYIVGNSAEKVITALKARGTL